MKKIIILSFITLFSLFNAYSQERTKMADGIYLVSYGNTFVIENDKLQRSETLSITKKESSIGEEVYEVLCGNKYSKTVAKYALSGAISAALTASGVASWASGLAAALTSTLYDDICNYYGDKYK